MKTLDLEHVFLWQPTFLRFAHMHASLCFLCSPNLPPREDMCTYTPRRKILSGLRLIFPDGGLRPCTGYNAPSKEACCEACKSNLTCAGWMYSQPLDCRNMGDPNPRSVCYMMSEITGSYDPIIDAAEYWSATAVY